LGGRVGQSVLLVIAEVLLLAEGIVSQYSQIAHVIIIVGAVEEAASTIRIATAIAHLDLSQSLHRPVISPGLD